MLKNKVKSSLFFTLTNNNCNSKKQISRLHNMQCCIFEFSKWKFRNVSFMKKDWDLYKFGSHITWHVSHYYNTSNRINWKNNLNLGWTKEAETQWFHNGSKNSIIAIHETLLIILILIISIHFNYINPNNLKRGLAFLPHFYLMFSLNSFFGHDPKELSS